jgi:tRNA threonylcarbamoyladenosine biosynthesis protein TsaE
VNRNGWPVVVTTDSPGATKELAARLAPLCQSGDVLLLIGDLGAGKTAFAQGFAAGLGVAGPVTSPTFALVRQYHCADGQDVETLIHADVYRTGSLSEVADLALAELVEERAVALIEWGDLAASAVGENALEVTLDLPDPGPSDPGPSDPGPSDRRVISLRGRGRWAERAAEVAQALSAQASKATS